MSTIDYYNENYEAFYGRTINRPEMLDVYEKYLKLLPQKAHICDMGCGVGRDSRYFKENGYEVTAFDGSKEMIRIASEILGSSHVKCLLFEDMDYNEIFDGVWASASLLHVSYENMREILIKAQRALKANGIFYASFKYGAEKRSVEGRDFYDMKEGMIKPYIDLKSRKM